MTQVPDPTFAQGIVGHGAAIDPPREIVEAVAPISGKVLQMFPHAYIIISDDNVGVLVHLGLDTVQLNGEGFTPHVAVGDRVVVGQRVITYDVPAVEAAGRNPIVPVVVMEKNPEDIIVADLVAAGGQLAAAQLLLVVNG
jgi:glucose-specific phosphotransferase system IIA component